MLTAFSELSPHRRLKRVHGRFQEAIRKDAPKLVTFLHERVNTEEGAEWSLQISQAKLSDRYQLPEEVGVMPLLALNFEEDFSLLFKLVPVSICRPECSILYGYFLNTSLEGVFYQGG